LIEETMDETVDESSMEGPLEVCLPQFDDDLDMDKLLEQADAISKSAPFESSENEEAAMPEPP
jgi:hypothetical protein